jgi:hypothetical protein
MEIRIIDEKDYRESEAEVLRKGSVVYESSPTGSQLRHESVILEH